MSLGIIGPGNRVIIRPRLTPLLALLVFLIGAQATSTSAMQLDLVSASRRIYTDGTSLYGDGSSNAGGASSEAFGVFDESASSIGGFVRQSSSITSDGVVATGISRAGQASISRALNELNVIFSVTETSYWRMAGEFEGGADNTYLRLRLNSEPQFGGESIYAAAPSGPERSFDQVIQLLAGTLYRIEFEQDEEYVRDAFDWSFAHTPIPEPSAALLIGLGLLGLSSIRNRQT